MALAQRVGVVVLMCVGMLALAIADGDTPPEALNFLFSTLTALSGVLLKSALSTGRAERSGVYLAEPAADLQESR